MGVFSECVIILELRNIPVKEKRRIQSCIKENGGTISYVINQKCTHVVVNDIDSLNETRLRKIEKYQIPVVSASFLWKCIQEGRLVDPDCCKAYEDSETTSETSDYSTDSVDFEDLTICEKPAEDGKKIGALRIYSDSDQDLPAFPQEFEVAKYIALEKTFEDGREEVVFVELQSSLQTSSVCFRIQAHFGGPYKSQGVVSRRRFIFTGCSDEALEIFSLYVQDLKEQDFRTAENISPALYLASDKALVMRLEEALNVKSITSEVGAFVEMIWAEALGHLEDILMCPVNKISINDVTKAEGVLLHAKKALERAADTREQRSIMTEFYQLVPLKKDLQFSVSKKMLSQKYDLCQLIKDMINACEAMQWSTEAPTFSKYRSLRCIIEEVDTYSTDFLKVRNLVLENRDQSDPPVCILKIFRVARVNEIQEFQSNLGNVQSLFHASSVNNFVGILSRGLLPPKIVVEDYGVERRDGGNLGSGIYFSNSVSTSIKYAEPSNTDGTCLMLVCDVALGSTKDYCQRDYTLTAPPDGFHSVHGVRRTSGSSSDFEDDELVVYSTNQVMMKYIVQFTTKGEQAKEFQPSLNLEADLLSDASEEEVGPVSYDEIFQLSDPLDEVKGGLLDSSGNQIPLQEVNVKGRIIDLIAQVVVFQTYINQSDIPIEAKYVFPLDETAAVCGFEAFINGKHIIGEVKEKEKAHHEYRQAIKEGHGAYLMDQDAPDVFTVSVGNLPPKATVLIKISYITELTQKSPGVMFRMPGAVAPFQRDSACNEKTQDTVQKVCVTEMEKTGGLYVAVSIEMPYDIQDIFCWSHTIRIKKTMCKAVVSMKTTESEHDFILYIRMKDYYIPRMWVEKHPDEESEACLVVFCPEHHTEQTNDIQYCDFTEFVILLDCSNSMKGSALQQAKQIAMYALSFIYDMKVNVITFGSDYKELFSYPQDLKNDRTEAEEFIKNAKPTMGNTDLWRPLRMLNLLPPSKGIRNVLLISDGYIQNESLTLKLIKNLKQTRIFSCGIGSTVNQHTLKLIARHGGGVYEWFDPKTKFNWTRKMSDILLQRMRELGCSSISVKWQQSSRTEQEPVQAPAQIQTLFPGSPLLLYGFVLRCSQAALFATLHEKEINTMVSTTELQKTKGTILHKLTARAIIRDYEEGMLHEEETEHEMKKQELKNMIISLSKKYSIVTQFTSFVAIEKRDADEVQITDSVNIAEIIAKEDVDILPYMDWEESDRVEALLLTQRSGSSSSECQHDMGFNLFDDSCGGVIFQEMRVVTPDIAKPSSGSTVSEMSQDDMGFNLFDDSCGGVTFQEMSSAVVTPDIAKPSSGSTVSEMSPHDIGFASFDDFGDGCQDMDYLSRTSNIATPFGSMVPEVESLVVEARDDDAIPHDGMVETDAGRSCSPFFKSRKTRELRTQQVLLRHPAATKMVQHEVSLEEERWQEVEETKDFFERKTFVLSSDSFVKDTAAQKPQSFGISLKGTSSRSFQDSLPSTQGPVLPQLAVAQQKLISPQQSFRGYGGASFDVPCAAVLDGFGSAYPSSSSAPLTFAISRPNSFAAAPPVVTERSSGGFSMSSGGGRLFGTSSLPCATGLKYTDDTSIAAPYLKSKFICASPSKLSNELFPLSSGALSSTLVADSSIPSDAKHLEAPTFPPPPRAPVFGTSSSLPVAAPLASFHQTASCAVFRFGMDDTTTAPLISQTLDSAPASPPRSPAYRPHLHAFVSSLPITTPSASLDHSSAAAAAPPPPPPPPPPPRCPRPPPPLRPSFGAPVSSLPVASPASLDHSSAAAVAALPPPPPPPPPPLPPRRPRPSFGAPVSSLPVASPASLDHSFAHAGVHFKRDETTAAPPIFQAWNRVSHIASSAGSTPCLPASPASASMLRPSVFKHVSKLHLQHTDYSALHPLDLRMGEKSTPHLITLSSQQQQILPAARDKTHLIPWELVFELQNEDGYWQFTLQLGAYLEMDLTYLHQFLVQNGIQSLGSKASNEVEWLVATLLILQLIRFTGQLEGIMLKTLFKMDECMTSSCEHWAFDSVKKAVEWVVKTEKKYPAICSRLQLGSDWEMATRRLLNIDPVKPDYPPRLAIMAAKCQEFGQKYISQLGLLCA